MMKIKEVCEKTGLTDRTVRFYIEEGLISPFYTENYLGRKSFDFSEQDVERLKDIATLRAFGFTVEEIKNLLNENGECRQIVENVKKRAEETLEENKRRINALASLDSLDSGDINTLVRELSVSATKIRNEKVNPIAFKSFFSFFKVCAIFLTVWLPIVLSVTGLVYRFCTLDAPTVNPAFFLCMLFCFLPSMATVLFFQNLKGGKKVIRTVFIGLCAVCIPLGVLFSTRSVVVCEHNFEVYRTTVQPTCLLEGEEILCCRNCLNFKTKTVAKLTHVPVIIHGRTPTCVAAGLTDGSYCSLCNEVLTEQTVIPKKEHTYWERTVQVTCGSDGYLLHECKDCKDGYKTDIVRATNEHDFTPNSNTEGYSCSKCNLQVVEHGIVDTSIGQNDQIKYYISGITGSGTDSGTLVIYGVGEIPSYRYEYYPDDSYYAYPKYADSIFMGNVDTVIIESGITALGRFTFKGRGNDNPFQGVKRIIIRSKSVYLTEGDQLLESLSNKYTLQIIYDY